MFLFKSIRFQSISKRKKKERKKMSTNPTFYGLTAKIVIPEIYTIDDLDEFEQNSTPEEQKKYQITREKVFQSLDRAINRYSKQSNILGYQHYEKTYPKNENLFDEADESESGDNLIDTP